MIPTIINKPAIMITDCIRSLNFFPISVSIRMMNIRPPSKMGIGIKLTIPTFTDNKAIKAKVDNKPVLSVP